MEGENRISRTNYIRTGGIDDGIVPGKATLTPGWREFLYESVRLGRSPKGNNITAYFTKILTRSLLLLNIKITIYITVHMVTHASRRQKIQGNRPL